jgi:hypothetical protein
VARERPTASTKQPILVGVHGDRRNADGPLLTRAESRALHRSAPLTHSQLETQLSSVAAARLRLL